MVDKETGEHLKLANIQGFNAEAQWKANGQKQKPDSALHIAASVHVYSVDEWANMWWNPLMGAEHQPNT